MRVRRAKPADARGILEVHRRAVHEIAGEVYDDEILEAWSPPVDDERVEQFIGGVFESEESNVMFVAIDGTRVLGFSEVVPANEELRAVYVDPEFTGRGLGTALLRQAEWAATQAGVDRLELDASLNAVDFYEKNGYTRLADGTHELSGGVEMDCVIMDKTFPG